jgi:arsenite methyltransferase
MVEKGVPEISYFELQAYMGTTKHMGGLETTKELVKLCHVDSGMHLLEVGCGVGATACYLAKTIGCSIVGVDLRESMVARARERAEKEGVTGKVEFRVASALDLPFDAASFDAVLCESVATFIEDKQTVAREFSRVTRPAGYVGLNEEIWLKTPPEGLGEQTKAFWDITADILTADAWRDMLENAGLEDVLVKTYHFDARRESSQFGRYRPGDMWQMFSRTLSLYMKNQAFREYMKKRRRLPRDVFEYLGYALFVGRK